MAASTVYGRQMRSTLLIAIVSIALRPRWSISGSGSGNTGGGTPGQTWQWSLAPSG
jgi:hypothetical protein